MILCIILGESILLCRYSLIGFNILLLFYEMFNLYQLIFKGGGGRLGDRPGHRQQRRRALPVLPLVDGGTIQVSFFYVGIK